jgi:hypothetical protein
MASPDDLLRAPSVKSVFPPHLHRTITVDNQIASPSPASTLPPWFGYLYLSNDRKRDHRPP